MDETNFLHDVNGVFTARKSLDGFFTIGVHWIKGREGGIIKISQEVT
jgi:hypothetical protein